MKAKVLSCVLATASVVGWPTDSPRAVTPLLEIRFSSDVTASFVAVVVNDEDVAAESPVGGVSVQSIGAIPPGADLDGYAVGSDGHALLSFDTTVVLPGGVTAGPADVVRYDGAAYTIAFDAEPVGVPAGANVDAVAVYGGSLLLSFDAAVNIGGVEFEREDLVLFDGAVFSLFFDGSAEGIAAGLDLDAADELDCNGHLLLSFDGGGIIGGVAFDDEDVLEFDRIGTWELAYGGFARHAAWHEADLDALRATPDLGPGPALVLGQTIQADAGKAMFRWPNPVAFKAVRGSFVSSTDIGAYSVTFSATGTGTAVTDAAVPAPGSGHWYLVKPSGCVRSSWQSTLGAEPGRDVAIP